MAFLALAPFLAVAAAAATTAGVEPAWRDLVLDLLQVRAQKVQLPGQDNSEIFALGVESSNDCEAGFVKVNNAADCQEAMSSLGFASWGREDDWADHPGGCFRNPDGGVYFNTGTGAAKDQRAPICVKVAESNVPESEAVESFAAGSDLQNLSAETETKDTSVSDAKAVSHQAANTRPSPQSEFLPEGNLSNLSAATDPNHELVRSNVPVNEKPDGDGDFLPASAFKTASTDANSVASTETDVASEKTDVASDAEAGEGPPGHADPDAVKEATYPSWKRRQDNGEGPWTPSAEDVANDDEPRDYIATPNGTADCPPNYKIIGNARTCRRAMNVLGLGLWGRKDQWVDRPTGCFFTPLGTVHLNNNTGISDGTCTIICEADVVMGAVGVYEARDAGGNWLSTTVNAKNADGTYAAVLSDGSEWNQVWPFNIRRIVDAGVTKAAFDKGEENGTRYNAFNHAWAHMVAQSMGNDVARELVHKALVGNDWVGFAKSRSLPSKFVKPRKFVTKQNEDAKEDTLDKFSTKAIKDARRAYVNGGKHFRRVDQFLKESSVDDTPEQSLARWLEIMKRRSMPERSLARWHEK